MSLQGEARFNRRAVKVAEAQRRVLEAVQPLPPETAALWRCGGRYLAQSCEATVDWPPFARAGMDGYAVHAADTAQATAEQPAVLRVTGTVAAGQVYAGTVQPGTAVRIMTGAAVPAGADAVVMLEQTAEAAEPGPRSVLVKAPALPGQNVAPRGEEFRRGAVIARPGTRLGPGHIAHLGTFGYAELQVHRRPRVAIFATGTELLPVGAPLEPGRIRDSNSAMIAALVESCGGEALPLGRLADDPAAVSLALEAALDEADAVITTGGVSVGDYDVMAVIMRKLRGGASNRADAVMPEAAAHGLLFDKVAMRPGSPTSAAMVNGKPLWALSGNPGACHVGFELFVRPALRRMQGSSSPLHRTVNARLGASVGKGSPHDRYVRAVLGERDGRWTADLLAFNKSSMMASLPEANALVRIPAGPAGAEAGAEVSVLLLGPLHE
ncbi:molybdopterin molybdotransferase MoeA [Paenibacillus tarimensis]|uniref:molybdopterin molybdotransferase MoeA n=1 Tax=Paenibacillus tarimensis TaxID=416012 RepID=UPI001F27F485|nr:gephyrin-like molybdotransferase Glp [Paenibacillus tarimensis]MCF2946297.1 molybdopterin molybdotransferase MoeA [Paenibacillus tarimensis]